MGARSEYERNKVAYLKKFLVEYFGEDVEINQPKMLAFIRETNESKPLTDKAIELCRLTSVDDSKGLKAMLMGDVASLIKEMTGNSIDWNELCYDPDTFYHKGIKYKIGESVIVSGHYAGYKNQYPCMYGTVFMREHYIPCVKLKINPDDTLQNDEIDLACWESIKKVHV